MRRIVILLGVILFCISTAALAGDSAISALGVKGGINQAKYLGDTLDTKYNTGGIFGGYMVIRLSGDLSMQTEVLFTVKGSIIEFRDPQYNYLFRYTDKLSYIEIPVLLRYTIPTKGSVQPHLMAGPAISILTAAKETGRVSYAHANFDIKDYLNNFDYNLILGVGINLKADNNWVTLDFRYERSNNKIYEDEYEIDFKNSAMSFIAGFEF